MSTKQEIGFSVEAIRRDFPILSETMRGKPLVYLDSAATSLKPQAVIDAEVEYLTKISANIHRGVYELSERATLMYDRARETIKAFLGVREDGEVVFTKSATEASNIISRSWGLKFVGADDEIVVSELEHHANIIPWQEVAKSTGATLRFVPLSADGSFDLEAVESVLSNRTRAVAITGMSNVTGFCPPIKEIVAAAHAAGAVVIVDGAQLVSHAPVDVAALDVDFLTFSGHKMCGPTGIGVLYGKRDLLNAMDPFLYGGDMIVRVKKDRATYKEAPDKFESGTPNISGAIGLGAAIDYLSSIGMDAIHEHEESLLRYARERLLDVSEVELIGAGDSGMAAGGIVSFTFGDIHSHDIGAILDSEGVAVRTGMHCAHPFMRFLGVNGTTRASFYLYNTRSDVDQLVRALDRVRETFA